MRTSRTSTLGRYYDPGTGRFLQRDPIGIRGGLNVYRYARAEPTLAVDPSGLSGWFQTPGGLWVRAGTFLSPTAGPSFFGLPTYGSLGATCGIIGAAVTVTVVVKEMIDTRNARIDEAGGDPRYQTPFNRNDPWDWVDGTSWERQRDRYREQQGGSGGGQAAG